MRIKHKDSMDRCKQKYVAVGAILSVPQVQIADGEVFKALAPPAYVLLSTPSFIPNRLVSFSSPGNYGCQLLVRKYPEILGVESEESVIREVGHS